VRRRPAGPGEGTLGALLSIYEGYHRITNPEPITSPLWAFGVLVAAMLFESYALQKAIKQANEQRRGRSWWRYVRETRRPEVLTVLAEDTAAETGLVLALIDVALTVLTGNPVYDGLGSIAIGLVLGTVAVRIRERVPATRFLYVETDAAAPDRAQA
jgi:Co/Zn/Cd efflux system component